MSTHTILATIPVGPRDEGAEVEALITYDFVPSAPDHYDASIGGPGGWEPGHDAEVSFVSAEPYCNGKPSPYYGSFADLELARLQEVAESWLDDEGYFDAVDNAEEASGPDPDDARDTAIDDALADRDDRMMEDW